ncbi:MAG: DUF6188 family protein [bacterium]|nr:DUF6188 family protein [bacterium]
MVDRNRPVETYALPEDRKIWSVEVDRQKITISTAEKELTIVSEQRLDFFDGSTWHYFEPNWEGGGKYDPIFMILAKDVESLQTCDGVLTVQLQAGLILKMEPHPEFESWHLYVPHGGMDSSPSGASA